VSETTESKPWQTRMPDDQFERMRDILGAPSPVGLEAAMNEGVIAPFFESFMLDGWALHRFKGNAGLVLDTHPAEDDRFTVMLIGHADKIRLQVRTIGDDGKIWVNSDSFLPTTLIGHQVQLFSEDPDAPGKYRVLRGGTIEAIGAIHFADARLRNGDSGIKKTQLYLELGAHGEDRKKQVEALGIKPGDSILLDRKIQRGVMPNSFYGAYLDNGLGCFVAAEIAKLIADHGGLKNVRVLSAMATHEEIGRMGSRVLAGLFAPDVVIGLDVNHDYEAAPGIKDRRMTPLKMGGGFTLTNGAITSEYLNTLIASASKDAGIPVQRSVSGRDTGTDAMAAVFAAIDAAATSIGFPIRNMHTISELGCTDDVLAAIHGVFEALKVMDGMNDGAGIRREDFIAGHPRLDMADTLEA